MARVIRLAARDAGEKSNENPAVDQSFESAFIIWLVNAGRASRCVAIELAVGRPNSPCDRSRPMQQQGLDRVKIVCK